MNYKAYIENPPEDMILRDHLAFDRTLLANERTGLAYIRTVLVALATGFTLMKLFPEDTMLLVLAYFSIATALVTMILGIRGHFKFQRKITTVYQPASTITPKKVPSENKEIDLISQ